MTNVFNFNTVHKELSKIENLKKIAGHMDIDDDQDDLDQQIAKLSLTEPSRPSSRPSTGLHNTEMINFIHKNGYRQSMAFKKQENYSFNELIIILNKLDSTWEENNTVSLRYPYIQ